MTRPWYWQFAVRERTLNANRREVRVETRSGGASLTQEGY